MMTVTRDWIDCADGCGLIERLAEIPGAAQVARGKLQITPGHIQANGISEDVIERTRRCNLMAAAVDRHYELDLMMQIRSAGRILHVAAFGHDRVRGLQEEKRRLLVRILPHLARVRRVIAPDAIDTVDRKARLVAHDRNRRL